MRYLGIDYGTKRVGISISDEMGKVAFPVSTISNKDALRDIGEIIKKEKISIVVLGESKDLDGTENILMDEIRTFSKRLEEECGVEIVLEPEYLTSVQAARMTEEKYLDASAATLILQSFLDKKDKAE